MGRSDGSWLSKERCRCLSMETSASLSPETLNFFFKARWRHFIHENESSLTLADSIENLLCCRKSSLYDNHSGAFPSKVSVLCTCVRNLDGFGHALVDQYRNFIHDFGIMNENVNFEGKSRNSLQGKAALKNCRKSECMCSYHHV